MADYNTLKLKFVILGESGVGKTAMLERLRSDKFNLSTPTTVGVDLCFFNFEPILNDIKHNVKIQLWDTGGQERFKCINKQYFRGADGIMLVFDVSNPNSLNEAVWWYEQSVNIVNDEAQYILIGSKSDLPHDESTIKKAEDVAKYYDMDFVQISSKTATNVESTFLQFVKNINNSCFKTCCNTNSINLPQILQSHCEPKKKKCCRF